jgi:hypothetical protein
MSYPVKEFAGPDPTNADIKKTFKSVCPPIEPTMRGSHNAEEYEQVL